MTFKRTFLTAVIAAIMVACSPRTLIVRQMTDMVDVGITAFERDSDLDLVERAIPAHIKLLEAMLANSPDDRRLITLLSRLYGSYGFGFVETRLETALFVPPSQGAAEPDIASLKGQLNRTYEKGMEYALDALDKRVPGVRPAFAKVATIAPYLEQMDKDDAAPLFWYGFNLGAWVNRNLDSIRAVSRAHVARKVMERVIELDPAYNHGGAHLFLLAYFGSRPPMMGGSQENALDHYHRLKQIAGNDYLLGDLFYGRFCLQQQQDREGFVDLMQRIIDHPAADNDMALYNAIAERRAGIYLGAVDTLFE
ncbi:TRAP transporter TatT component family protein [uncultured Desulfosarcina sp.]|uniref:TRAP transporter TatT component family protein n=1 Tax=uncultured Desulfosarcina sp. TaxID=218289 RepID=UPI0029C6A53A|nr:TRAP transporter TatT component family protein [uncultured Desulfosarcina sp.]